MAQITQGTVSVSLGDQNISFNDASIDLSSVFPGSIFIITEQNQAVPYFIATVDNSSKTATLTGTYQATSNLTASYSITTSFTSPGSIAFPEKNDIQTATIVKQAIIRIQELLTVGGLNPQPLDNFAAVAIPGISDDASSGYSIGSHWLFDGIFYQLSDATNGSAQWIALNNDGASDAAIHDELAMNSL